MFEERAPDAGRFSPADRRVVFLAALVLFVIMGMRQCIGLFILPLHQATGMTLAEISLAVAVGQLVWGAAQPLVGFWADKRGAWSVLMLGALCVALGQICTIWADSLPLLLLTQGLLFPAGAAGGGFTILIGVVMARLGAEKRSLAGGLINA